METCTNTSISTLEMGANLLQAYIPLKKEKYEGLYVELQLYSKRNFTHLALKNGNVLI